MLKLISIPTFSDSHHWMSYGYKRALVDNSLQRKSILVMPAQMPEPLYKQVTLPA